MKNALRWITVPFAAILGSFIVYAAARLLVGVNLLGLMTYTGEGVRVFSLTSILTELFVQATSGYGFVLFGTYAAPSNKKIVSIILATIFCCFIAVSLYLILINNSSFWQVVCIIAGAIGAIFASFSTKDEVN